MTGVYALPAGGWVIAAASAFIVGLSKTGIPGLGIIFVPLFVMVLPARISTGALLPLLIVGDLIAVVWYRRDAVWGHSCASFPGQLPASSSGSLPWEGSTTGSCGRSSGSWSS